MDTSNTPLDGVPGAPASETIPESTPTTVEPFAEPEAPPVQVRAEPAGPQEHVKSAFTTDDIEAHKFVAALSYLGILVFIPLLLKRDSAFARKHSAQGVLLLIAWVIGALVFWIPFVGWVAGIFLLVVNIIALVRCVQGEFWEIPVIGEYRQKLGLDDK